MVSEEQLATIKANLEVCGRAGCRYWSCDDVGALYMAVRSLAARLAEADKNLGRLQPLLIQWRNARRAGMVGDMDGAVPYSPLAQELQHLVTELWGDGLAAALAPGAGEGEG